MHERHVIFYVKGQLYQYSYATVRPPPCSAALPCCRPLHNGPVTSYSWHQRWPLYVISASQHRITTRVVHEAEKIIGADDIFAVDAFLYKLLNRRWVRMMCPSAALNPTSYNSTLTTRRQNETVASLGWVSPGAATEGVTCHPYFCWINWRPFLFITVCQFCGVTSVSFPLKNWRPFLVSPPEGCHPAPFYLSDLICPLFFCKFAHKKIFLQVSPHWRVSPRAVRAPFPLVTPLGGYSLAHINRTKTNLHLKEANYVEALAVLLDKARQVSIICVQTYKQIEQFDKQAWHVWQTFRH